MVSLLAVLGVLAARHPIHSSAAVLTLAPGAARATLEVRVFLDDFPPGRDSASAARYLATRFTLGEPGGRTLPLRLDRIAAEGRVLLLELSLPAPHGLSGLQVWHGVLAERFTDQVNLLQAHYAGRSLSLLFSARDGPKPLP